MSRIARLASVLVLATLVLGACGETLDLVGADMSVGLPNGDACGGASDCTSAHCVDGVCCESACTGVCEACNVDGAKGICSPVPAMTDPAMECVPQPVLMVDGGTDDGGTQINIPDAGINAMQGPCAPRCDGNRACGFPDAAVTCGDTFCNDSSNLGASVCDGAGHCGVSVTACVAYTCGPKACKTSCTSDGDCQGGFFCNASGACQQKKANGISCGSNPDECTSGFCANGVCCNSDCGSIPGGVCNQAGAVGTCKCVVNAKSCAGTCEYYYPDADNDGYGKKSDPGLVECTGDPTNPPPPLYVRDHTDCGDDDNRVHPGQGFLSDTNWTSVWSPHFDWNCDGVATLQYPQYPGASCRFCNPEGVSSFIIGGGTCGGNQATCVSANQYASLNCGLSQCNSSSGFLCLSRCCGQGCANPGFFRVNTWGFTSGGACGTTGTATLCGQCAGVGTGASGTVTFSQAQGCM